MSTGLPHFRCHPDPVASGSVRESAETCACCGLAPGWIYTATFFTRLDVSGSFCPWCIADGSAAERFAGEFADGYGLDGVSEETIEQVTRRTPGFHAWQDPHWLVHCNDAAAFVGRSDTPSRRPIPRLSTSFDSTFGHAAGTTHPSSRAS
nr:CbrC family protein [Streptomyces sp. NBC_00995]